MARAKEHGNGRLEDALQALVQAQATLVQTQAAYLAQKPETDKRIAKFEKRNDDWQRQANDRFARIEAILLEHNRILSEHAKFLEKLPDLIGEKIGFKPPKPPAA